MCRKCAIEQNWHQRFLAMRIRWDSRHSLQAQSATCAALVPCFWSSGALHLLPKPALRADCAGIDNFLPPDFEGANER